MAELLSESIRRNREVLLLLSGDSPVARTSSGLAGAILVAVSIASSGLRGLSRKAGSGATEGRRTVKG
jgi:hypothetical protein